MLGSVIVVCFFERKTWDCAMRLWVSVIAHDIWTCCLSFCEVILTVNEMEIWNKTSVPVDPAYRTSHPLPLYRDDLFSVGICVLLDLRRCLHAVS
jgi:hypothetical protein